MRRRAVVDGCGARVRACVRALARVFAQALKGCLASRWASAAEAAGRAARARAHHQPVPTRPTLGLKTLGLITPQAGSLRPATTAATTAVAAAQHTRP
jgi:hypothetical protein